MFPVDVNPEPMLVDEGDSKTASNTRSFRKKHDPSLTSRSADCIPKVRPRRVSRPPRILYDTSIPMSLKRQRESTKGQKKRRRHSKKTDWMKHKIEPVPVAPIFVWVKKEDDKIVDVVCQDYDKRNRIRLAKTENGGWRTIPVLTPYQPPLVNNNAFNNHSSSSLDNQSSTHEHESNCSSLPSLLPLDPHRLKHVKSVSAKARSTACNNENTVDSTVPNIEVVPDRESPAAFHGFSGDKIPTEPEQESRSDDFPSTNSLENDSPQCSTSADSRSNEYLDQQNTAGNVNEDLSAHGSDPTTEENNDQEKSHPVCASNPQSPTDAVALMETDIQDLSMPRCSLEIDEAQLQDTAEGAMDESSAGETEVSIAISDECIKLERVSSPRECVSDPLEESDQETLRNVDNHNEDVGIDLSTGVEVLSLNRVKSENESPILLSKPICQTLNVRKPTALGRSSARNRFQMNRLKGEPPAAHVCPQTPHPPQTVKDIAPRTTASLQSEPLDLGKEKRDEVTITSQPPSEPSSDLNVSQTLLDPLESSSNVNVPQNSPVLDPSEPSPGLNLPQNSPSLNPSEPSPYQNVSHNSRLLDLLKTPSKFVDTKPQSDPLEQLNDVLSNPKYMVPDPLLVPKDRLSALVASPGEEIPRLLSQNVWRDISVHSILSNPDMLVVSLSDLQSLLTKTLNEEWILRYQKQTEKIRSRLCQKYFSSVDTNGNWAMTPNWNSYLPLSKHSPTNSSYYSPFPTLTVPGSKMQVESPRKSPGWRELSALQQMSTAYVCGGVNDDNNNKKAYSAAWSQDMPFYECCQNVSVPNSATFSNFNDSTIVPFVSDKPNDHSSSFPFLSSPPFMAPPTKPINETQLYNPLLRNFHSKVMPDLKPFGESLYPSHHGIIARGNKSLKESISIEEKKSVTKEERENHPPAKEVKTENSKHPLVPKIKVRKHLVDPNQHSSRLLNHNTHIFRPDTASSTASGGHNLWHPLFNRSPSGSSIIKWFALPEENNVGVGDGAELPEDSNEE